MGRMGVDIYPLQIGTSLRSTSRRFGKFLGGSAGQRRRGRSPARAPQRDHHPHRGRPVRRVRARRPGRASASTTATSTPVADLPTPVTFCEIFPPDDFPLYFYRRPSAPDLQITADELDLDAIRDAEIFWVDGDRAVRGAEPRGHAGGRVRARARPRLHRARPGLPADVLGVPRGGPQVVQEALPHRRPSPSATSTSARVAVGEREPDAAAERCSTAVSSWRSSSRARRASSATTRPDARRRSPPVPVDVVNGLGAGDAFGGGLCHGLLAGWPISRRACGSPTPPARSSRRAWSAPTRCRRPPRSGRSPNGEPGGRSLDDHRCQRPGSPTVCGRPGRDRRGCGEAPPPARCWAITAG